MLDVGTGYDRLAGVATPTQDLLKRADEELRQHVPGGILIKGSGGKGLATFTPWVGVFDPDETETPQDGVYVVYLFTEDLTGVTLTLNQGITRLTKELGPEPARKKLGADAARIREALPAEAIAGLQSSMELGAGGYRQRAYEAGNIAARTYRPENLPDEAQLLEDLHRFFRFYQLAVEVKRRLLQAEPGSISSASVQRTSVAEDPLHGFKPKNDSDYVARLTGKSLIKSRRHEQLVREYGLWMRQKGFKPTTEHPKDLVLKRGTHEWLIEAKVLYNGNATDAVRRALGQLLRIDILSIRLNDARPSWRYFLSLSATALSASSKPAASIRFGKARAAGGISYRDRSGVGRLVHLGQ